MRRIYQLLIGGLMAVLMVDIASPAIAQEKRQQYISAFTPEEEAIIEREYRIENPGSRYAVSIWQPHGVVRREGEGKERWILVALGKDTFGNQFFINSRSTKFVEEISEYSLRANFIIQVVYNNPGAHNGVALRLVSMQADCLRSFVRNPIYSMPNQYDLELQIYGYIDYDSSGNVVARKRLSGYPRQASSILEAQHAQRGCEIADRLPKQLELLDRGLKRQNLAEPSIYD